MPGIRRVDAVPPVARPVAHQRIAQETAALLANLVKAIASGKEFTEPVDIRKLPLDPASLSELVRRAGLESHMAETEPALQGQTALQNVLNRVSPQHLAKLLSVLQESEQPAVNHDQTYGEAVSLGDIGSSRTTSRTDAIFRELWSHGGDISASRPDENIPDDDQFSAGEEFEGWSAYAGEQAGWHHAHVPPQARPDLSPPVALHPAMLGAVLALAVLVPALLLLAPG